MTCFLMHMQAHSSVERAGLIGGMRMHKVPTDDKFAVRGEALRRIIEEDKKAGLIPTYVSEPDFSLADNGT